MEIPTLVVSNPPHGQVDLEAAAKVLDLDPFATRLKAKFTAPEVMAASDPEEAVDFASALRGTGFTVSILHGATLTGVPWPAPASFLALDESCLRATVGDRSVEIPYDVEVAGVYCRPPADRWPTPRADIAQAVKSGHGPTIAEAVQRTSIVDLYFREKGSLRRVSIVPDFLELVGDPIVNELVRRFKRLRLDTRLTGVRPRAPFVSGGEGHDGPERRRYSFGTLRLRQALESISDELATIPQWEFGSRLSYALDPLTGTP
jgi:hypothetical protein